MAVARSINNFKATGKYGCEKPTSPPKCTTKLLDDATILSAKKSPRKTSKGIQAALPQDVVLPSQKTICRKLFHVNLKSYRPAKSSKLSQKNIAACLTFCQKYQGWTSEQWKRVMFSNETQISQFYAFCRHV